jgi:hypothetical protein
LPTYSAIEEPTFDIDGYYTTTVKSEPPPTNLTQPTPSLQPLSTHPHGTSQPQASAPGTNLSSTKESMLMPPSVPHRD